MTRLSSALSPLQAIVLGVVIVGCATAATITGHLPGSDLLAVLTGVGGGATGVAGAHVGASQVSAALGSSAQMAPATPAPTAPPAPVAPFPGTGPAVIGGPGA